MSICDTCNVNSHCSKYLNKVPVDSVFCIRNFKMNALFDLSFMSDKQRRHIALRYDFDGTDREQFVKLNQISQHVEQFVTQGCNLYLHSSNCGNGKTSWALRIAQQYIRRIWHKTDIKPRVMFISVPKFFLMLKDNISNPNDYIAQIKANVVDCNLVVWDDIGTKMGTEFEVENLLNIINNRIDNGKSNIYTSNMLPDQLKQRVGERLYSRIVNLSTVIELRGVDKRGMR